MHISIIIGSYFINIAFFYSHILSEKKKAKITFDKTGVTNVKYIYVLWISHRLKCTNATRRSAASFTNCGHSFITHQENVH